MTGETTVLLSLFHHVNLHFFSATLPYTKFRLHPDHGSLPATSLAFNPRLPLLGVGVGDGSTQIWRLPVTLTERVPKALQLLSKLAAEEE